MEIEIIPAYHAARRGPARPVRNGWHLIIDGEWAQWFATRMEAKHAALNLAGPGDVINNTFKGD